MQKLAYLFCCLLIVIATTVTVFAQGTASRVTGTVLDPKGAAVPGAAVTLTNEATKLSFDTQTTSVGIEKLKKALPRLRVFGAH